LYAAIDLDTKLIFDVALFGRHGTDPAAAFLSGLAEKHDLSDTTFLVNQLGYRTAFEYWERSTIREMTQPYRRFHISDKLSNRVSENISFAK
jgi:transposase-like protein